MKLHIIFFFFKEVLMYISISLIEVSASKYLKNISHTLYG